jgi:hypothetical protein
VKGRQSHPGVSFDVNPSSRQILQDLTRMGATLDLISAGARLHQSGGMGCIGMGQAPAKERNSLRTMPRNFPEAKRGSSFVFWESRLELGAGRFFQAPDGRGVRVRAQPSGVGSMRDCGIRVAEPHRHGFHIEPIQNPVRGSRVAEVVESVMPCDSLPADCSLQVARVQSTAARGVEEEISRALPSRLLSKDYLRPCEEGNPAFSGSCDVTVGVFGVP